MKKIKNLIGIVLLVTIITFISIGQSFAAIQADSTTDIVINNVINNVLLLENFSIPPRNFFYT